MYEKETCDFIRANGFDICSIIGRGGFSQCYDVFSRQYNQHFVCKAISIEGSKGEARKKSYDNELKALTNILHPNIIQVFQAFSNSTHVFIILEYCQKGDFAKLVKDQGPIKDKVTLLKYVSKILEALSYLEINNIAHRDIKPSNIFIDKYGRPKIADFGLASFIDKQKLCEEYDGSLVFAAPEVLCRKPYDSSKADIWSFGVTVFYMATGEYPFPINNTKTLKHSIMLGLVNIPSDLDEPIKTIIANSLRVDPSKRMPFSQMKSIVQEHLGKMLNETSNLPFIHKYGAQEYHTYLQTTRKSKSNGILLRPKPYSYLIKSHSERFTLH